MPIKVKDAAALQAMALERYKKFTGKGMDQGDAAQMVQEWLDSSEFANEAGDNLTLSFNVGANGPTFDTKAFAAEIGAAVKDAMAGLVTVKGGGNIPGANPSDINSQLAEWEQQLDDPTWGFANMADYAYAVRKATVLPSMGLDFRLGNLNKAHQVIKGGGWAPKTKNMGRGIDVKYGDGNTINQKATPTTYASELVGADGGFMVPPEYKEQVWIAVTEQESILPMTDVTPTSSNVVNLVADENTPWDNSTGVFVGTRNQATTMTQSKPVLQNRQIQLNEVYALVPCTDELLQDAPRLNNYLTQKVPQKIGFKVDELLFRGKGNGEPLGFLNANCLVVPSTSSGSNTFGLVDLTNMLSQMLYPNIRNTQAAWFMTPRAYAYLLNLTTTTVGYPIALSSQNIAGEVIPTTFAMPIYNTQHASAFSAQGDVILANMKGYAAFVKTDGIDFQTSIHLFFDSGATAFRWRFRMGGEPYLKTAVTPAQESSSYKYSHFVAMPAR